MPAPARPTAWGLAAALLLLPLGAGAAPKGLKARLDDVKQQLTPGFAAGSHLHAYQSYAFVYSFANGNAVAHERAVAAVLADGVPLLRALRAAGAQPRLEVSAQALSGGLEHVITLHLQVKGRPVTLTGGAGVTEQAWRGAAAAAAAGTGVPQAQIEAGHAAWFQLARVMNGLQTEADTLTRHAFALEVLAEQTRQGQAADWFGPRPPAETLADVAHAQALLTDDVARVRGAQAAILATLAIANLGPAAEPALVAELEATRADLAAWQASHRMPTPADFGVSYQVPTPDRVKEVLDEQLGVVGAAVDLVRGAATGDLPRTLDGLAGLAPKDSKARAVTEGLAAASRGDIAGTVAALADLGGPDTAVGRAAGRLDAALQLVGR